MATDEYQRLNHANWEERVALHAASKDYALDRYRSDPAHLSDVVRFDLPRLGTIDGLDLVHLQCHIGTDTLSLARLGARVTGLDFSAAALGVARELFAACHTDGEFVHAPLYDAVDALGPARFDLVYTGIGALNWLPDIRRWAAVVASLLRPGGRLFIREGHPVLFSLDDEREDDLLVIEHPHVETTDGVRFDDDGTYVDHEGTIDASTTIEFNHGLAEVITSVIDAGMELTAIEEHDTVPWLALPQVMVERGGGEFGLRDRPERLPLTFTLQAQKR